MPDTSVVNPSWVDIVAPAAPATSIDPLLVGAVLLLAIAVTVVTTLYYRHPRRRARRALQRLTRKLSANAVDTRATADEVARQLRRAHACRNLAALDFGPAHRDRWLDFLARLARYRFAAAPPASPELRAVIATALRWIARNGSVV
jgi:hypothetical protein